MNMYNEPNRGNSTDKNKNPDQANTANAAGRSAKVEDTAKPATGDGTVQVTSAASTKEKWPQQVKAAKNQWGKLSEAELLKSDGNPQQLSGLVQQRYDIGLDVAEKQVKTFLDKCNAA